MGWGLEGSGGERRGREGEKYLPRTYVYVDEYQNIHMNKNSNTPRYIYLTYT